jgi:hypothetical protein
MDRKTYALILVSDTVPINYSLRLLLWLFSLAVKPIAEGILSLLCYSKEIEHLQSISSTH